MLCGVILSGTDKTSDSRFPARPTKRDDRGIARVLQFDVVLRRSHARIRQAFCETDRHA